MPSCNCRRSRRCEPQYGDAARYSNQAACMRHENGPALPSATIDGRPAALRIASATLSVRAYGYTEFGTLPQPVVALSLRTTSVTCSATDGHVVNRALIAGRILPADRSVDANRPPRHAPCFRRDQSPPRRG